MPERNASTLSKLNLFLMILLVGALFATVEKHDRLLKFLHDSMVETGLVKNPIDFSVTDVQMIDYRFLMAMAEQEQHLGGVKYSGRIINTQSVIFENLRFSIEVDGKTKEFGVSKISPGNSTRFEVYVPNVKIQNAQFATIRFINAMVKFQR